MKREWEDSFDPGGLTQGPEEQLEREIARSKALKVERLQFRDRVASLETEVGKLKKENAGLIQRLAEGSQKTGGCSVEEGSLSCWSWGMTFAGGLALGVLAGYFWF